MFPPLPFAVPVRCISRRGGRARTSRRLLRYREPAWTGSLETSGGDQFSEQRPLDRPAEPLPHLVLVREDRGTNADEDELRERLVLVRLPRFVPDLIPTRKLARVAMSSFAVIDRNVARHDSRDCLELLTHLSQLRCGEAQLTLDIVELGRSRGFQMAHQTRALVAGGVCLGERGARQRIDRARHRLMAEQPLAAMHLEREHPGTCRQLAAPRPLGLRPRPETGRSSFVWLL